MAKNNNLLKAKETRNNEFYTGLTDISEELMHYKNHFKDKVIYCNCDNPYESNFVKYFLVNFNSLGLKKLYATCYSPVNIQENLFSDNILANDKAYFLEVNHIDKDFKKEQELRNILDNVLENRENILSELRGDGSFDSEECLSILDKSDIVITNPPFSLFREYIEHLIKYRKHFLIIGNKNSINYNKFFRLLRHNDLWLGYEIPSEFYTPNGITKSISGLCRWFTNLDIKKRHEDLILQKKYTPEKYPKYENYDAINVDKVSDIPCDYFGVMGVPITFFDKYNPSQFEIIGKSGDIDWATSECSFFTPPSFDKQQQCELPPGQAW